KQEDGDPGARSKQALRHELISLLLEGGVKEPAEIAGRVERLKLAIDMEHLMVTVMEIDDFWSMEERYTPSELEVILNTVVEISRKLMNEWEKSVIAPMGRGRFVMIFSLGHSPSK